VLGHVAAGRGVIVRRRRIGVARQKLPSVGRPAPRGSLVYRALTGM
jgi:hypothetical protein